MSLRGSTPTYDGHARQEDVVRASQGGYRNGFSLQISDSAHPVGPEQFVAACMDASQEDNGFPGVDLNNERRRVRHADVHIAGRKRLVEPAELELDVLDIGEPLASQEFLRDVLRRHTDARYANQSDSRRLRRRLGGLRFTAQAPKSAGSGERGRAQKFSSTPTFSIV